MALNIKNPEVEQLAADLARLNSETKTEAIRIALRERSQRLKFRIADQDRKKRLVRFMEEEIWPLVPDKEKGRALTRRKKDEILGYGPDGVRLSLHPP